MHTPTYVHSLTHTHTHTLTHTLTHSHTHTHTLTHTIWAPTPIIVNFFINYHVVNRNRLGVTVVVTRIGYAIIGYSVQKTKVLTPTRHSLGAYDWERDSL